MLCFIFGLHFRVRHSIFGTRTRWHERRESNSHQRFWRPVCYHCTKPLCCKFLMPSAWLENLRTLLPFAFMVGAITLQATPAITALLFILASYSHMSRVMSKYQEYCYSWTYFVVGFSSFNAFPLLVLIWGVLTHNRSTDLQTLAFLVCDHSVRLSNSPAGSISFI